MPASSSSTTSPNACRRPAARRKSRPTAPAGADSTIRDAIASIIGGIAAKRAIYGASRADIRTAITPQRGKGASAPGRPGGLGNLDQRALDDGFARHVGRFGGHLSFGQDPEAAGEQRFVPSI